MADTYVSITFVADELLTSTKMNQLAANQANFHNGTALGDGIIVTRHIASANISSSKLSLDLVSFTLPSSFSTSSTSMQDTGLKLTLPTAGKWIVFAEVRSMSSSVGNFGVIEMYNFTAGATVSDSTRLAAYASGGNERQMETVIRPIATTTPNNVVGIRLKSGGAYTVSVEADPNGVSTIFAVRIG